MKTPALLLTLTLALVACTPPGPKTTDANTINLDAKPAKTAALSVTTLSATRGTLDATRTVTGTVNAARDSNVAARASGVVTRALVQEGDAVRAGQTLVQLDDTALRQAADSARLSLQSARINLQQARTTTAGSGTALQSAVQAAQANLQKAQATAAANRDLYALGGLSRADLNAGEAALAQAQADLAQARNNLTQNGRSGSGSLALLENQVQSAQVALAQAESNLANARVRAPFAGVVAGVTAKVGEFVNTGASVARIVDPATLDVDFSVPPTDAVSLGAGRTVTLSSGGRTFTARIRESSRVAGTDRLVPVTARLTDAALPVGATLQVRYTVQLGSGTIIPASALQNDDGGNAVFVAENGAARRVNVTVIGESNGRVAVTGLPSGARIISPVPPSLQPGVAINVTNSAERAK
ncbi:efflux RND transporter periplasmic adaptor subunit [Deinococcus maricopensis]|uniref:Efflux transporter, RND family, MFP subunit n=1 Tax=Deinococcus maricopensis (strain DSM 21211 / LMG 22137 / NRRL B-23946 / LB-34) TaxID=709986 RepID=E8U828_DEIML|nr:efflux RND transporter periplasmic adaptor subunit [Deinococcus maricopensis]ADV67217.1 efflux transporter, RND family, MFP subunit [Deinococcus maricopensis DSM 21211]